MISLIAITVFMLCISSFGCATLMEVYKKKIRKDKASTVEIRIVSAVLSLLIGFFFKCAGVLFPITSTIVPSMATVGVWIDMVIYSAIIWFLQLKEDMTLLKQLIKLAAPLVAKSDFTGVVKTLINTTGASKDDIVTMLNLLSVTKENATELLQKLGIDDTSAQEIIEKVYGALSDDTATETVTE